MTQNEARAEVLENQKSNIDSLIETLRELRNYAKSLELWTQWDREIDKLLTEKDNLSGKSLVDWMIAESELAPALRFNGFEVEEVTHYDHSCPVCHQPEGQVCDCDEIAYVGYNGDSLPF